MQLMLHAGLRAAEVLALTVYDLDWLSGQLTVRQGKGKKDRILWLNEPVLDQWGHANKKGRFYSAEA
jgi:integrase